MAKKKKSVKVKAKKTPLEESKITPEIPVQLPNIPFSVYKNLSGLKWDQIAGFESYVKRNSLGPMTVPNWTKAFQHFMGKPTK